MDGRHQSFNDTVLVVDDLGSQIQLEKTVGGVYLCEGSKTVGGARGVGDDIVFGLVSIEIDATDKHGSIGRGSRNDDLLGPTLEMGTSLVLGGEDSC